MSPLQYRLTQRTFFFRPIRHPWILTALYSPIFLLLISFALRQSSSFLSSALWIGAGIFSFTLIEYLMHRFIFHLVRVPKTIQILTSEHHLTHHRHMNEPALTQSPFFTGLIFTGLFYAIFYGLLGNMAKASWMSAGILMGYIIYSWVHYGVHQYRMDSRIGRFWKHYHLYHHLNSPCHFYGVTSPFWDLVFGTYPKK